MHERCRRTEPDDARRTLDEANRDREWLDFAIAEIDALGVEEGELPGGRYLRARLRGEPPAVYERIGPTFTALVRRATPDERRPSIEFIVTQTGGHVGFVGGSLIAILAVTGASWVGPLSLRKPAVFGLSFGITRLELCHPDRRKRFASIPLRRLSIGGG